MKLIVIIPALNEQATIARVVRGVPRRIAGIDDIKVIVLDDGSSDSTAIEAEAAGATVISLTGRRGLGVVFRTGLEKALRRGADVIVNIDGDGQFDPADIPALIAPILEDRADFVTCTRFADRRRRRDMPAVKYWGNRLVTRMINLICEGTCFTDVSCGFRAFSRDAACRLTLFGRFTYTQETFIDLVAKGVRIVEVPLAVRGEREYGQSRVCPSVWRYAVGTLPIILRAMRDIQPLKFFGKIGLLFGLFGAAMGAFVLGWYLVHHRTSPFSSLIVVSGMLIIVALLMGVLALLADMMGRHRKITEELLYLARQRGYSRRSRRTGRVRADTQGDDGARELPVMRSID